MQPLFTGSLGASKGGSDCGYGKMQLFLERKKSVSELVYACLCQEQVSSLVESQVLTAESLTVFGAKGARSRGRCRRSMELKSSNLTGPCLKTRLGRCVDFPNAS